MHDAQRLKELQALPLERKIQITQTRIIEWYQHYNGQVCVSFSGGKDSTVLLHIARKLYPDIPAVFSNTGLEYPEIQKFVKSFNNVDIVTPSMRFSEVVSTYGYPIIGKEVAEAIYYARRIRREDDSAEKTPQRKKAELFGVRVKDNLIETSGARNRRTVLQGKWEKISDCKGDIKTAGETESNVTEWSDWRRGCLGNGKTYGEKSMFNKEKYLPLARDVPVLISHYCCFKMKKSPMHKYQSKHKYKPILATLAEESRVRKQGWIRHGCNAFESKNPMSQPMSFWTEQDVLAYIVKYDIEIASVYGEIVSVDKDGTEYPPTDVFGNVNCNLKCTGCQRTGCIFCAFGLHGEKGKTRFQLLAETHPKQYEYSIGGGQWVDNPYYDPAAPEYDGEWKNWNPKKIWVPSKKGLGMGKVFDMVNEIYGKDFYRYE